MSGASVLHLPRERSVRAHSLPSQRVTNVQAMHLIVAVISQIQCPPRTRDPTMPDMVLHNLIGPKVTMPHHILGPAVSRHRHPSRSPRQMLDDAIHALALHCPLHRRRTHALPHCHQRMHQTTRCLLTLQDTLQAFTRQSLFRSQTRTHSPHRGLVHNIPHAR